MPAIKDTIKNLSRLHGYWTFKTFLSRSQYWSSERREKYVLANLRQTLVRASEGIPFYRERFQRAGFDPLKDFHSPEDLARVPLLTKEDVRQHFNEIVDHRFEPGSIVTHTSGSTGEPLPMRLNESFMAFDNGCFFRHLSWAGYTFGARMAALRTYVPTDSSGPLWRHTRLKNTLYLSAYHLTPANCSEYVERILQFRPKVIKAYPSSIAIFAEFAYPYREKFDFLQGIFTASETLLPSERDRIERTFGKKLFNWYGMTEPAVVITECEQHEGMHINWEYGYSEFLPSSDLAPEEFRLVTTGFHNPVMPFIRYDTGDIVRLYEGPTTCPCGRTMPTVNSVVGRKDECIITPDGRRLPSINFYSVFRQYPQILKFQIIQYGRSEVSARIALRSDDCDRAGLVTRLEQELAVRLGPMVKLNVECTPQFITNPDGKTLTIVRRLGTRSLEESEEYKISSQRAWEMDANGEQVFKLDWNESDQLPSPLVPDALRRLLRNPHAIHWYPEAASHEFKTAIADYAGVSPEHVLPTHGSDLAMELLATCFVRPGDKVLVVWPSYDHFRAVIEQRGAEIVKFKYCGYDPFPTDDFRDALRRHTPRLAYLVNPNNPIGYVINRDRIKELLDYCTTLSTVLIVDEAYFEFSGVTVADLVSSSSHLVVTRSFSKAFGLAGLRLGYLLASGQLMHVLNRAQNPKSVTMFAKTAALTALQDIKHVQSYVEEVRQSRERYEMFFKQHGIKYFPSCGNFVLFQYDAAADLVRHMEQHRVFMRDRTAQFDGAGHIRLTVGSRISTEVTVSKLEEYFADRKQTRVSSTDPLVTVPTRGGGFECSEPTSSKLAN